MLGHPPPGWQKKMLMSLNDETIARPEDRLDKLVSFPGHMSSSSVAHVVGGNLECGDQLPLQCPSALVRASANVSDPFRSGTGCLQGSPSVFSSSPRSSTGSDSESSLINTVVPSNAKERILAAAAPQQHPPNSRMWFQRPATTSTATKNYSVSLYIADIPNLCRAARIWRR